MVLMHLVDHLGDVPYSKALNPSDFAPTVDSAEDVYKILLELGEDIGLATVYRVLNQFDDAGIVSRHHFESGKAVFELSTQHHHDHLVCLSCGKVIEFSDEVIERRQDEIAMKHNIKLTNHSLYLYGTCTNDTCEHNDA